MHETLLRRRAPETAAVCFSWPPECGGMAFATLTQAGWRSAAHVHDFKRLIRLLDGLPVR